MSQNSCRHRNTTTPTATEPTKPTEPTDPTEPTEPQKKEQKQPNRTTTNLPPPLPHPPSFSDAASVQEREHPKGRHRGNRIWDSPHRVGEAVHVLIVIVNRNGSGQTTKRQRTNNSGGNNKDTTNHNHGEQTTQRSTATWLVSYRIRNGNAQKAKRNTINFVAP